MFYENDIRVKYIDMEHGIHEQVYDAKDGTFTVFLNSRDSVDMQKLSYEHAVDHITNKDFDTDGDVQIIELKRHGIEVAPEHEQIMSQEEIQRRINNLRKRHRKLKRECAKHRKYNKLLRQIGIDTEPKI